MSDKKIRVNPFFEPYGTPHNVVAWDSIALSDYEEAILEGIRRDDEQVELIVSNSEAPTFDNTLIFRDPAKGDYYCGLLERVSTAMACMLSCETSDELEALAQKMSPLLTKHANDMSLNAALFKRIQAVYEHHRELTSEEATLLEHVYKGFVRGGALLDEEGKERLRALTEEASLLALQFSQNLLKERKAYALHITDEQLLEGLPPTALEAARIAAQEREAEGYIFTLDAPSYSPFLTYASNRELRKEMYMAYNTLCIKDNAENNLSICSRLINLRREIAQLLGYESFAAYVLEQRMASSVANVEHFLDELIDAYKPVAEQERAALIAKAKEMEGDDFELMPWDSAFYSHKLRMERYNIDAEMLRPYLPLEKVIEGVFALAHTLYGIVFKAADLPVYHPDVKAYEVYDADGTFLAVFYADFFPRAGKKGGAWMTEFQGQWIDRQGNNIRPHVSVVMNFTKSTPDKPALLTLSEVETFLHEFGHALHGMFANTRFASLSGTNVWWDFVELPSQFMENYALEKDFLLTFAHHYATGEALPDEYIERLVEGRNFMAATACLRQVSFGLLDMAYYTKTDAFTDDILSFEKQAWQRAILGKQLEDTCMTTQFSHIMAGGYAAGYYSYKWAEVLDADAFAVFKREGLFSRSVAQRFRENILSRGGTEHPAVLYRRFKGSDATIDALLERNGISVPARGKEFAHFAERSQKSAKLIKEGDKQHKLDLRYLRMARIWSENSYCERRRVGCLVVKNKMIISDGYNGTPSGFENVCEDESGATKPYVLHAEANAITKLARSENNSDGATLYVTSSPCIECAKLIIQSGISRVVYSENYRLSDGIDLLRTAGIEVVYKEMDSIKKD